ncbi:hypothetical protein GCM10010495_69090 [Kitasatospora herbaricolor]|nr:hypothetical protein GCM10010495_69090 [Kitasatospora herbaricolor]
MGEGLTVCGCSRAGGEGPLRRWGNGGDETEDTDRHAGCEGVISAPISWLVKAEPAGRASVTNMKQSLHLAKEMVDV